MQVFSFNIIDKKNKDIIIFFTFIMGFLGFSGCNDIFEKDISEESPTVILPTANDTLYSNNIHFKWEKLDGASFYNLQVVQPSFANINSFILDSNINAEQFFQILPPGKYEFRLKGENGGYSSLYAGPFSFYVDSVLDLTSQFVSLNTPENNIYITGIDNLSISWQNLYAADNYDFILKKGTDFTSASIIDQVFSINGFSYTVNADFLNIEGIYFWGIRGVNVLGTSPYSSRQINVDKTKPNNPELVTPTDGTIISGETEITFKWQKGIDPGIVHSPVFSTLEISSSASFISFTEFSDLSSDTLVYEFPTIGEFWWRIKLVDGANNQSEFYSTPNKIILE